MIAIEPVDHGLLIRWLAGHASDGRFASVACDIRAPSSVNQ